MPGGRAGGGPGGEAQGERCEREKDKKRRAPGGKNERRRKNGRADNAPPRLSHPHHTTHYPTLIQAHFPVVAEIDVPDDVNRVLLAYKRPGLAVPAGDAGAARAAVEGLGKLGGGAAAYADPGACVDGPSLVDLALEARLR